MDYNYRKESGEQEIRFTNLREKEAAAEDTEARRQNRKFLLTEKPQVRFLEENESAYRVIQIYDKGLKEELLYYMGAVEYQAKRYRRNLGYQD